MGVLVARKITHPCQPSPIPLSRRPAHRPFRGLLGVHSRCGLHTRTVTKFVTAIRGLQTFRRLHACPGCFRLERSPGGPYTHWKTPPCHGARGNRSIAGTQAGDRRLRRPSGDGGDAACSTRRAIWTNRSGSTVARPGWSVIRRPDRTRTLRSRSRSRCGIIGAALVLGFVVAISETTNWDLILRFIYQVPYGRDDTRAHEALGHYDRAIDRLKAGDWAGFGAELDALRPLLDQLSRQPATR
jgi:hypothetical protein